MSSLSSIFIPLLLCISLLYQCNARKLRVEVNEGHKTQLQHLNKDNDQNVMNTGSSDLDPSLLNKLEDVERDSKVKQNRVNDDHNTKQNKSYKQIREAMKDRRVLLRSKDLVSVSFRVPRNNEGLDHHPGFNMDYAPPKTHPPTHN